MDTGDWALRQRHRWWILPKHSWLQKTGNHWLQSLSCLNRGFLHFTWYRKLNDISTLQLFFRGIDINNNTSEIRLCNFSDKLLFDEDVAKVVQHPGISFDYSGTFVINCLMKWPIFSEILISLMFIEKADPNDWIEFTGILTSRIPLSPFNHKDELQICFVDKESSKAICLFFVKIFNIENWKSLNWSKNDFRSGGRQRPIEWWHTSAIYDERIMALSWMFQCIKLWSEIQEWYQRCQRG